MNREALEKEINDALSVKEMTESEGWKILVKFLRSKIKEADDKRKYTLDPMVHVMSATTVKTLELVIEAPALLSSNAKLANAIIIEELSKNKREVNRYDV